MPGIRRSRKQQVSGREPSFGHPQAIEQVKQFGIIPAWDEYWDRYFGYELREINGGVTAATDRGAVLEDLGYGNAMYWSGPQAPVDALWHAVTMPVLVLRARQEIMPGFGFILPAAEAERFAAAVPSARVAEIDANHYTIIMHDDSIAAIDAFLRTSLHPGDAASALATTGNVQETTRVDGCPVT